MSSGGCLPKFTDSALQMCRHCLAFQHLGLLQPEASGCFISALGDKPTQSSSN